MYWVNTKFPNLILLTLKQSWLEQREVYETEFAALIEETNNPPKWLKRITKNKNLESPEISFQLLGDDPWEWMDEFDMEAVGSENDEFFQMEDVAYLTDINREILEIKHECDLNKFLYFELGTPWGFYVATTDGIEYESPDEFWEAVRNSKEIVFGNSEYETASEDFWGFGISSCSQCIPTCTDDFEANANKAIQEILDSESLSTTQIETIDNLLMRVLSDPEEHQVEDDELEQMKDLLVELTQKYSGDFPQVEYWLATN